MTGPSSDVAEDPGYLVVDRFLGGIVESLVLEHACTAGLLDELAADGYPLEVLDERPRYFLEVLEASGVVEQRDGRYVLSEGFRPVLDHRDLLEAKLSLGRILVQDLAGDAGRVFGVSRLDRGHPGAYKALFAYSSAEVTDPDELRATETWVRYMTVLTKYEAPVGISRYDFGAHRRMLDVGGNSGEFVLQVCSAHPDLRATVFDLPTVTRLGAEWNEAHPARDRVEFVAGDAFQQPLPGGHDLVSFKGVLHDWPDAEAERLVRAAWSALEPGGTFLVFERSSWSRTEHHPLRFDELTMLVWGYLFRGPARYERWLGELGAVDVEVQHFDLDLPWMLLTARKPG